FSGADAWSLCSTRCCAGVGLGSLVEATAAEDLAPGAVSYRFYTRHGIRPAGSFVTAVCPQDRRLPVLRSNTVANLPLGSVAVPDRNRVRRGRGVATWPVTLARSVERGRDSGVLDRGSEW